MIEIKNVAFASPAYFALLELRQTILRAPLGLKLSAGDTASDDREIHVGAFENGRVVGCVLLRPIDAETLKLRQMAVLEPFQGQGIGAALVENAEAIGRVRGFRKMEMHARRHAQGFYEKLGYQTAGEEFTEVTVPTIRMHKFL